MREESTSDCMKGMELGLDFVETRIKQKGVDYEKTEMKQ